MNDRQLRYALAVRKELSFSRAASRLLVSQPSISEQVSLLEAEIGFPLFRRTGRGVEVTRPGRVFLRHAEDAVSGFLSLNDVARHLKFGPVSGFSLGMSSGLVQLVMPVILAALRPSLADIKLSVVTAMAPQLQRLVLQEEVDAGIMVQVTPRSAHPALDWKTIAQIDMALFVAPGHRLAGRESAIDIAELANEPLIMSDPALGYGALVQSMFADRGLQPHVTAIGDQAGPIKMMVRSGLGVAILPLLVAAPEVALGELVRLPLRPNRKVSLCSVRRAKPLGADIEACIAQMSDALTQQDWTCLGGTDNGPAPAQHGRRAADAILIEEGEPPAKS